MFTLQAKLFYLLVAWPGIAVMKQFCEMPDRTLMLPPLKKYLKEQTQFEHMLLLSKNM